ncbi:MAG: aminopeptidase C [Clostridia bacterium]|jgi:bleomycin hydrolase
MEHTKLAGISKEQINMFSENYHSKKHNLAMTNAVTRSGIQGVAYDHGVPARMQHTFSIELDTMKVTNQKASGRCWLFAGLNILREKVAKKYNLEDFELSQNYQAFWDKFEKINYFLESIIETVEEPLDSRIVTWLLQTAVHDGGQWDMFVNLVEKYGVVPKSAMPETFHSSNTGVMNQLLVAKLREYASILRRLHERGDTIEKLRAAKEDMLREMYTFLCIFFGEPPATITFEIRNKEKEFFRVESITPLDFYHRMIDMDLGEYISIINAPTSDKPYGRTFTVRFLGNVKEGKEVIYLNTDIDTMKRLTIAQLRDNEQVWFGCDVGKMMDRGLGILDAQLYRYDLALGIPFGLTKAERLDYRESCMTHAMVFTGVNLLEDGKPNRWKVENSWGDERGQKGYYVMSDSWFDEYMYQVVVHKKYLSDELKKALEQKSIELPPWDPMGSLALMK